MAITPRKNPEKTGLVYSTEHGRMCPNCRNPVAKCVCKSNKPPSNPDGMVRVRLETKGRKGKGVTVIEGAPVAGAELDALGKALKQRCGSGGTVKEGNIEIQGDHRATIISELTRLGWKVKKT